MARLLLTAFTLRKKKCNGWAFPNIIWARLWDADEDISYTVLDNTFCAKQKRIKTEMNNNTLSVWGIKSKLNHRVNQSV